MTKPRVEEMPGREAVRRAADEPLDFVPDLADADVLLATVRSALGNAAAR